MPCDLFKLDGASLPGFAKVVPTHNYIEDARRTVSGKKRVDYVATKWEASVMFTGLSGAERLEIIARVNGDMGVRMVETVEFTGQAFVRISRDDPVFGYRAQGDWSAGNITLQVEEV